MMKISMNWISDYVNIKDIDLKELANKITNAGVNVEQIEKCELNNLVVGFIKEVNKHPDSDHLNICLVDLGNEIKQIVCGAHNVKAGIKVIVALEGAILPGNFEIKKTTIRGVESSGMICALFELGLEEKTEENYNKGIHILSEEAPVGKDAIEYLGLNDTVYGLDLNPNRNDCLSHIGFAYEVAAVLRRKVTMPDVSYNPIKENIKDYFNLKVNTKDCTMYKAKMVKGVKVKESPEFIKNRLTASGIRSINNVVDISNYVMLEYGQPLHFFDKTKLGNKIVVRNAFDNEKTVTLDDKERILKQSDVVITNGDEIVAIAGVMGCLNSGIDENTKDILIESAIFNPLSVRYTSIEQNLRSEASLRFEKGLNYEYTELAIERACHLLEKYADAEIVSGTVSYDVVDKTPKIVTVTREKINKVLGLNLTDEEILDSFNAVGFDVKLDEGTYTVLIPNRCMDISIKEDLIEEVGRMYGYDKIEGVLPVAPTIEGGYSGFTKYRKNLTKLMRSLGFNETRTHTLVSEEEYNKFQYQNKEFLKIEKPLSMDKIIIRQTIIPSLLKVIEYNLARGVNDIMIYEISNVYSSLEEQTKLAVALKGNIISSKWNNIQIKTDFYYVKGIVEEVLEYLGLNNRYIFKTTETIPTNMHPHMSAEVFVDNEPVGYFGKVHPKEAKDIYVLELNLNKLYTKRTKSIKYNEPSKYPSISKDLAFIFNENVLSADVERIIRKTAGKLLSNLELFDLYTGENVRENEKSLAYSLMFTDHNKTLVEDEVNQIINKIIKEVENKLNGRLRDK
ncbi:MAG TPA: phenylalanine--tRNA ligase subunit beta [Tenericutes bacterium]|nr:phenylalanine--tRNA ligase subunit beta [Mycoplasmatota bacterium]